MHIKEEQLKKFIIESGLVSKADIKAAEEETESSNDAFADVLLKQGKIKEDDLRRMEAYVLGIPFVSLIGQKIDFAVLSLIPEPIATKHNIVAYKKTSKGLEVAMLDIDDLSVLDFVKKKLLILIEK